MTEEIGIVCSRCHNEQYWTLDLNTLVLDPITIVCESCSAMDEAFPLHQIRRECWKWLQVASIDAKKKRPLNEMGWMNLRDSMERIADLAESMNERLWRRERGNH